MFLRRQNKPFSKRLYLKRADLQFDDDGLGIDKTYTYEIYLSGERASVGYVSLRIGKDQGAMCYLGHIGYRIYPRWRGHHLAEKAVRRLKADMQKNGLQQVIITCNPENIASVRTCERLGCRLEQVVSVPEAYRGILMGATHKCRYLLDVETLEDNDD